MMANLHHAEYATFATSLKENVLKELEMSYEALSNDTTFWVSNLANAASLIWHAYHSLNIPVNWAGFYIMQSSNTKELLLGPFQGKVACQTIQIGRGVCGTAASQKCFQCVPDVNQYEGHIACDGETKSEIVVPLLHEGEVMGVLDIDCLVYEGFNEVDIRCLGLLARKISNLIDWSLIN